MIRRAVLNDMDAILCIVRTVTVEMQNSGNNQWNETYPAYQDFYNDILEKQLFVETDNAGIVKGFICLNNHEPLEYEGVSWGLNQQALVIHRMAVKPKFQGQGVAQHLMIFAEERAKELDLNYIRTDTCRQNISMNFLFNKLQYNPVGEIHLHGYKFTYMCYEKVLK